MDPKTGRASKKKAPAGADALKKRCETGKNARSGARRATRAAAFAAALTPTTAATATVPTTTTAALTATFMAVSTG